MTQASRKGEQCLSYSHAPPRSLDYSIVMFIEQAILGYPPTVLFSLPSVVLSATSSQRHASSLTASPPSCLATHGWPGCTHDQSQLWLL